MQIHMSRHGDDLEPTSTLLECASCMASVTDFESFCRRWQKSRPAPQASGLRMSQGVKALGCVSAPGISVLREQKALGVVDALREDAYLRTSCHGIIQDVACDRLLVARYDYPHELVI